MSGRTTPCDSRTKRTHYIAYMRCSPCACHKRRVRGEGWRFGNVEFILAELLNLGRHVWFQIVYSFHIQIAS